MRTSIVIMFIFSLLMGACHNSDNAFVERYNQLQEELFTLKAKMEQDSAMNAEFIQYLRDELEDKEEQLRLESAGNVFGHLLVEYEGVIESSVDHNILIATDEFTTNSVWEYRYPVIIDGEVFVSCNEFWNEKESMWYVKPLDKVFYGDDKVEALLAIERCFTFQSIPLNEFNLSYLIMR